MAPPVSAAGRGVTGRAAACVLLAALLALAGCAVTSGQRKPAGPGAAHGADVIGGPGAGLAALRAGLARPGRGPSYYLSLGDSLAQGIQPAPAGNDVRTRSGYPDQLAGRLRGLIPGLRLVKLGCSGETTSTMIHGGICRYPAGSQLAEAARFLRSHRGRVALVTIDIGANDPNSCVLGAQPLSVPGCLYHRVPEIERNLSAILARLRAAAGSRVLIVGMTYYVPELELWRRDLRGRQIAVITDSFAAGVGKLLTARYHRAGARVADVFGAFRSADFGRALRHGLRAAITPPNVTAVCSLTWMCAAPPRGPNEHANNAGYRVIAGAFWRAIMG